jgi:hypothetical protein
MNAHRECLPAMGFQIVGPVREIETIATGRGIRQLQELKEEFGGRRWRKRKGVATVLIATSEVRLAEVHWYEAHGVGSVRWKIKTFLDR